MRVRSILVVVGLSTVAGVAGSIACSSPFGEAASDRADATGPDGNGSSQDAADGSSSPLPDTGAPDTGTPDAQPRPPCDLTASFGTPTPVTAAGGAGDQFGGTESDDGLKFYFHEVTVAPKAARLLALSRARIGDPFVDRVPFENGQFEKVGYYQVWPSIVAGGTLLFFAQSPDDGSNYDIFSTSRANAASAWPTPVAVPGLDNPDWDMEPHFHAATNTMFFSRGNSADIWVATVTNGTASGAIKLPINVDGSRDGSPVVTSDGLTLYFASDRRGSDAIDVWLATRGSTGATFTNPQRVTALSTTANENPTSISADGCRLYLGSDRDGGGKGYDMFVASKPPAQ